MAYKYKGREKEYRKEYNKEYNRTHRGQILAQVKVYQQTHKEQRNKRDRECYQKLKIEVLTYYGNGKLTCVQCGFDDVRALSIDHINGGGTQHRKSLGIPKGGTNFYNWLKSQGFPEGYQTLCMNCQFIKTKTNNECF